MNGRRVVITGLGVVAPNGIGNDGFWENLIIGKSAVDYVTLVDASRLPCTIAAEVRDFNPADFMHVRRTKHRGRFSQFAVAAAKLALEDARVAINREVPERIMVCMGTSMNGVTDVYEAARSGYVGTGVSGIPRWSGIEYAAHAAASHVSIELCIKGQAMTLASACTAGLDVVQWAYSEITRGRADLVFAGGTDAPINSELSVATLCALGVLTSYSGPPERASRPYDLHRDGLVLGEGAAVYTLESLDHALERDATIYAEVLGFGSGNEGGFGPHIAASELALTEAICTALAQANLSPTDLDYINAHGNALPDYDIVETQAFKHALGDAAYNVPISSIKSMIGHAMGAASSFQVAAACMAIQHQMIPPTINLETPDPQCDLDYVPRTARHARVRKVLINAHAMGGTHSVLILGTPELC
jgi:3-oxoacyl-[acyl-carrier-protein] synthase II